MTTMDSDSASQDSDDGRRFRFEATRKDSVAPINTINRENTPSRKHKSSRCENSRHYRDRKEQPKYESGRKMDDKDLRHSTKYSKYESRSSRQEDGKNSHKDHRNGRDGSAGSTVNDRGSRNSSGGETRERLRDSKRQSDRDRSSYQAQRSRERSYERNHHDERALSDKYRSRYYERHKHRSRDRSRDRSHQSSRVKSSNDDYRSREDNGKHDSSRKTSIKENRLQNLRDYPSPKNVEQARSHSEVRSNENTKKDSSLDAQDCKDLDLSQFDVLSETDDNMSDNRDSGSRTSSPRSRKINLEMHDSRDRSENLTTKRARENGDGASKREWREELRKVKRRNYDLASSSSNNNPSAVSDSSLGSASSTTLSITKETCASSEKEKSEHYEEERMIACDSCGERSGVKEKNLQHPDVFLDQTQLLENDTEQIGSIYGPPLPPGFAFNTSKEDEFEKISSNTIDEEINNELNDKSTSFIGPRLPSRLNDCQSTEREDAKDVMPATKTDVFGPALPPHLLQRCRDNDSQDKIIGPVLPNTVKLCKEDSVVSSEPDDDCGIGPLPVDHPALRNSHVHEQLDLRAQKIRGEKYSKEVDIANKREEWMTELPSAQAVNLGLGPRKFRIRDGPDMSDRSCWTDTPTQKAQKQRDAETRRLSNMRESDKKHVKEFHKEEADKSEKSEKSLLQIHQSKIARKKRKEEKEAKRIGISTRRPFDRDIDLQVNRFDQAQKKTILMKAQLLDDRFSRGQI